MRTQTKEMQAEITPEKALQILVEGNKRFAQNLKANRNLLEQVNETRDGQYPFATILSCIDSRVPAELVFDQGLGDIFNIRVAGNVLSDDVIGSMEFACKAAGAKLIVILGHTRCGAVKGACDDVKLGKLTGLVNKIKPAVEVIRQQDKDYGKSDNPEFLEEVAKQNVGHVIADTLKQSEVLAELAREGKIDIVGAMYYVESGMVEFHSPNR